MKRALSVILCFVFVLLSVPFSALPAAADTYGDYRYNVFDGEASIDRYIGSGGDVVIPSRLGVYNVTSIGSNAFSECTSLTSVTIPNSVKFIGEWAFSECTSLTSVTIPGSVTSICNYAFDNCTSLTNVIIGNGVTTIGGWAFRDCTGLTSITIPDSVTFIGYYAFIGCTGLTSITIPDSVTSIGDWAFEDCTSLTSITIPDGVTSIGVGAFSDCTSLTIITVDKNNPVYHSSGNCIIETASKTLVAGCKSSIIPSDGSVTSIGGGAFEGCESLTSITIPGSVTSIGRSAFSYCTSLTSITIPNSVTSIGEYAFASCLSLTSITIPDSVTSIGDYAFYNCTSLTSATIPTGVTSIGEFAFYGCTSLTGITIPDSVTSIGRYAFNNCTSLSSIYFTGTEEQWAAIGIGKGNDPLTNATIVYNYKPGSVDDDFRYEIENGEATITGYNGEGGDVVIPSRLGGYAVTSIGNFAFEYCASITSVTIPDSVASIGAAAFEGCGSLARINIPNGVKSIGRGQFQFCCSLESITIPVGVTGIGDYAFNGCTSLTTVYYNGTKEQWAAIRTGAYNKPLTDATKVYNGMFAYLSTFTDKNEVYDYHYEDAFFYYSAYEYDHELARMSLCAAMAAFGYYKNENIHGSENIRDLFVKIGIDPDSIYDHYEKPTDASDSIGFVIGTKKISCPDGDYSLLAVTIRGGGYKDEWISNFTMGASGDHKGFSESAKVVVNAIKSYIEKYSEWYGGELLPDLKVWITGYSRASAVTNLTAAYLDNAVFKNEIPGLKLKDIYAYGFEVPKGRSFNTPGSDSAIYNNIFSIVNPNDAVPRLAPGEYGFGRYGITLEIPTYQNMYLLTKAQNHYNNQMLPAMQAEYKKILKKLSVRDHDDYKYDADPNLPLWCDVLVAALAKAIGTREDFLKIQNALSHAVCYAMYDDYAERVSPITVDIQDLLSNWVTAYTNAGSDKSDIALLINALVMIKSPAYKSVAIRMGAYNIVLSKSQVDELLSGLCAYVYLVTGKPTSIIELASLIKGVFDRINDPNSKENVLDVLLDKLKLLSIGHAHYPELCLAWMNATDLLAASGKTRYLYVHCPVDVNVYDGNGKLVASVENDAVKKQGEGPVQAYVDAVGTKIFLLPDSEEYRVEVTATDNGEVDYSVAEYDHSAGMFTRYVDYKGITVNKGDNLNGKIDDLDNVVAPEYELRNTADKPIAAANDVQGAEANALALEDHSNLDLDLNEFLIDYVPGDVNGNGKIDSKDYAMTKRAFLKTYTLTDEQLLRADINGNGKVDSKDYAMIKRHFLKTYVIPGAEGA